LQEIKDMVIRKRRARNNRGFSLVEMLVVLGIIVVMGTILSFSYWNVLHREQLAGSADIVFSMISSARQAAIANRESRWLEIDLTGDSLQIFKKVYIYDRESGNEYEDYEAVTALERTTADIADITTSPDGPLDMDIWLTIVERQLPIRLEFNPRGVLVAMYYRSPDSGLWEETAVQNPIIHVYTLIKTGQDAEVGSEIRFGGESLPYRDPHGSRNDVLNNPTWRERLQGLPSDSDERKKCYSIRVYEATGRAFIFDYGIGYPWPKSLMPETS
jgi:prepilin-type N-terminal cleavage/methylation domain-containing protein